LFEGVRQTTSLPTVSIVDVDKILIYFNKLLCCLRSGCSLMLNITMRHKYLNGTSKTRVIQHPLFLESEKMHITTEVFVIIKSVIRTFFALKTCISKLSNRPFATYCKRPKITRQLNKALIVVVSGRAKDVIERFDPDLHQFFWCLCAPNAVSRSTGPGSS